MCNHDVNIINFIVLRTGRQQMAKKNTKHAVLEKDLIQLTSCA
jgi:hypothetical protein